MRVDDENDENIQLDVRLHGRKTENRIKEIDKAISSFELTDNITVYRNVDAGFILDYFDALYEDTQALVGKELEEKGYTSTALIKSGVLTDETKDCKIEMTIPAGKGRGAYINELSNYKDTEYEFLIARDSKFRITEVQETDELLLKMEMIADE